MQQFVFSYHHKMYAILLIFVVSFNLVSSDVVNVQQLLERVDLLELKLASLSNAYEMLLEDRHQQSQCNCSDLKEDIQELATLIQTNEVDIEAKVQSNTADFYLFVCLFILFVFLRQLIASSG